MAIDLMKFASQGLEYVRPTLFEVEFLSDKLTTQDVERLKLACHKVELITAGGHVFARLSFYNDEDGFVEAALSAANTISSPFTVFSFYKDGELRRSERFPEMTMDASKVVLDWAQTDRIGSIDVEYGPVPVDTIENVFYHRKALETDE